MSKRNRESTRMLGTAVMQKPPDGGWGWVVVFAAFATNVVWGGLYNSYGILYREFLNTFQEPRSYTSWIGSVLSGVGYASGIIASGLINKFGIRPVAMTGTIFASIFCFVSSFADSVLSLIILFGLFVGFGHALSYTATYIIVPYYFERRRGLATGIAISGSGVGNFIFAPLMRYLLTEYTWRGFMIIESGIILQCCVFAALYRPLKVVKMPSGFDLDSGFDEIEEQEKIHSPEPQNPDETLEDYRIRLYSDVTDNRPYGYKAKPKHKTSGGNSSGSRKFSYAQTTLIERAKNMRSQSVGFYSQDDWERFLKTDEGNTIKWLLLDAMHMNSSPFLRKDVFYASGLNKVPEYKSNVDGYTQSILSIPKDLDQMLPELLPTEANLVQPRCICSKRKCMTTLMGIHQVFGLYLLAKPEFVLFAFAAFAFFFGYYVPTSVLYDYSGQLEYSKNQGILLVSVMGIANTVGRVGIGFVADLKGVNRIHLYSSIMIVMGLLNESCWMFHYNFAVIMTYVVAFSLAVGAAKSLLIVVAVDLMGIENLTSAYGLLLLFQGFGFLLGNPFAGLLFDVSGSYALPFSVLGGVIILSGVMTLLTVKIKDKNLHFPCCLYS